MTKKRKRKIKKFMFSMKSALGIGAAAIFGIMIIQGTLAIFPTVAGSVLIIIGVLGLTLLTYFGMKGKN